MAKMNKVLVTRSWKGLAVCCQTQCNGVVSLENCKPLASGVVSSSIPKLTERNQIKPCFTCGCDCVVCADCAKTEEDFTCFVCTERDDR